MLWFKDVVFVPWGGYKLKLSVTFRFGMAVTTTVTFTSEMLNVEVTVNPFFQVISTTSGSGASGRDRYICTERRISSYLLLPIKLNLMKIFLQHFSQYLLLQSSFTENNVWKSFFSPQCSLEDSRIWLNLLPSAKKSCRLIQWCFRWTSFPLDSL